MAKTGRFAAFVLSSIAVSAIATAALNAPSMNLDMFRGGEIVSGTSSRAGSVSQGDTIYVKDDDAGIFYTKCTLGFIDQANRVGYTAGHCVRDGEMVYDSELRELGVGHVIAYNDTDDRGWIEFREDADLGENQFSGDAVWKPVIGERACIYGNTTRTVQCSTIADVTDSEEIIFDTTVTSQKGDSGGPIWNDKGPIGVINGYLTDSSTGEVKGVYGASLR